MAEINQDVGALSKSILDERIDRINQASGQIEELKDQVQKLGNRLFGARPENAQVQAPSNTVKMTPNAIDSLDGSINNLYENISNLAAYFDRLRDLA